MQPLFTCLQPDELKKFIAGDMSPKRIDEIEDHLSTCEACRGSLEASVGDRDWWQHLESALRSDTTDGEYEYSESKESVCQRLTAMLGPTDDPSMLGRIGPYEIIGLLGYGGMGAVFKARDPGLNRYVAIKILLPHLAVTGAARARFRREGQAAAAIIDDCVLPIYVVDEWQGVPYLVMQYTRGSSLQKRIHDRGPLDLKEILRIGMQAARGLAAAHAQGLVHRDVKPSNILLDGSVDRALLTDFGLARAVDDASLTTSGVIAGTPQYMSPEQARAEAVDHRSDLFSLGSVMYAMCTGHAPFRAESSYSVLRLITDKEPRPIREINPDVPEWLCSIIEKLMAKHTGERYHSAKQVSELLANCLAHLQQPTAIPLPDTITPQPKNFIRRPPLGRALAISAAAFGLILAGIIIVLEWSKGTLAIESEFDGVPIRIVQHNEVVDELTVSKSGKSVRIAAGNYHVEIGGQFDGLSLDKETVTLSRGGNEVIRIARTSGGVAEASQPIERTDAPSGTDEPLPVKEPDLSSPQATLDYIGRYTLAHPTDVPTECYTDEALLEMSGVMLQQLVFMSAISQVYMRLESQVLAQRAHSSQTRASVPVFPHSSPSFPIQVDALLKQQSLPAPPEECERAFERLTKLTVATLGSEESPVQPDRELYRLAAGTLISPKEFLPRAGELSKRFNSHSSDGNSATRRVSSTPKYEIQINGDEATAAALVVGSTATSPMRFKLRRVNQRWLVSESFSDELLSQTFSGMSEVLRVTKGIETELANQLEGADSTNSLDALEVRSAAPRAWSDFIALLPERGTALVMFSDETEIRKQMLPIAKKVARAASAPLIEILPTASPTNDPHTNSQPSTHFLLMKDQQVVDTRYGALTEAKLKEFVAEAEDWLTPHSMGVEENSLVRVDCYITTGASNIGTQIGNAFPITTAVVAVHEHQAILLGPDSIGEYLEKGYACFAVVRDAAGEQKQVPLEVLHSGPVKLLGKNLEPHKRQASVRITHSDGTASELPITSILPDPDLIPTPLEKYDVDTAIYRIRGFHGLKPVKLAAIAETITVGERVLSGSFSQKPIVPVVLGFSPPMQWQTQNVVSIDGVYGGNMHGPETFDVLCPSLPVPSGFTFNEHGRLIGKYAYGSPTHEDMKHGVLKSHATHSILRAVLVNLDDAGLKAALVRTLEESIAIPDEASVTFAPTSDVDVHATPEGKAFDYDAISRFRSGPVMNYSVLVDTTGQGRPPAIGGYADIFVNIHDDNPTDPEVRPLIRGALVTNTKDPDPTTTRNRRVELELALTQIEMERIQSHEHRNTFTFHTVDDPNQQVKSR